MWKKFSVSAVLILTSFAHTASGQEKQGNDTILPIEQFTKYDEFESPKLSPQGNYVAYMTGKYGRSVIAVISIKEKKMVGGNRCPDGFEIFDFDWKSDSRIVYRIAERHAEMNQPIPTGEIFAVNFDGKQGQIVYGYRAGELKIGTSIQRRDSSYATAKMITPLLSDDKNILIAEYPWHQYADGWRIDLDAKPTITQLDVFSGKKQPPSRAPLRFATVLVDQKDQVRFAIGRNEQLKFSASWKPDPKGEWQAFTLPEFENGSVIPQLIAADNQSVYFTGIHDNESLTALYNLKLDTHEVTKVFGFESTDVTSLVMNLERTRIVGVVTDVDKPQIHWLNPDDRAVKIYRALDSAFRGQTVSIASVSHDGRLAIVFVDSDVNPGDYYLFDTQSMKADYFYSARKWIAADSMHAKEPVTIKARDGVELHGYLTRPDKVDSHPMVVLPHEGPHGIRDYWDYDWEVQLLASRGYSVLQVNYRGSDGFGMDFLSSGFHEWGAKMQDDITDATRWAIDNKFAQADRICIFGARFGGYAALMGAVREPKLYRCAIGYEGLYDLELIQSTGDFSVSKYGRNYLNMALGNDKTQLRSRSPVFNAEKIQIPVLLIHGKEDSRADFAQAKRMKAALEANNKEFEWMALSHEGHGAYDEKTRLEVYERILKFLDRYLPANAAAK